MRGDLTFSNGHPSFNVMACDKEASQMFWVNMSKVPFDCSLPLAYSFEVTLVAVLKEVSKSIL